MKKEVRNFIGYASYYCRFIEDFSKIASPFFRLLTKDAKFNWFNACNTTLTKLKKLVSQAPILHGPQWEFPFHISSDASDTAMELYLDKKKIKKKHMLFILLARI